MSEKNFDTPSSVVPDRFGLTEFVIDESDKVEYVVDSKNPRYPKPVCFLCEQRDKQHFLKCLLNDSAYRLMSCDYDMKPIPEPEGERMKFPDGSESPPIVRPGSKVYDLIAIKYCQADVHTEKKLKNNE